MLTDGSNSRDRSLARLLWLLGGGGRSVSIMTRGNTDTDGYFSFPKSKSPLPFLSVFENRYQARSFIKVKWLTQTSEERGVPVPLFPV